jgi:hypothetical protein
MDDKDCSCDFVVQGPAVATDTRVGVRHVKGETEVVVMRKCVDGRPLPSGAEIVMLDAPDAYGVQDVRDSFWVPGDGGTDKPAMVTSNAYRAGWDAVFGGRNTQSDAN